MNTCQMRIRLGGILVLGVASGVESRPSRPHPWRETTDSSEVVWDGQPWITSGGCSLVLSVPALFTEELV